MDNRIDIVCAVHNGAEFIPEFIESLREQTCETWRLIVRDEASTDGTAGIVREFARKDPERFVLIQDTVKRGACQNFARALELSTADYTMCADCDDQWFRDKIEITFDRMRSLEAAHGKATPLLVYTDLTVVDRNLAVLDPSFWHYQHLNPENGRELSKLMIYNVTTGCTMMMNRALREMALPIPPEAVMHDNWLSMTAAAFGKADYLPVPTLFYRQHGKNDSGARQYNLPYIMRKTREYLSRRKPPMFERGEPHQAEAFLRRYRNRMDARDVAVMEDFIRLDRSASFRRKGLILKRRFFKPGLLRNLALLYKA